MERYTKWVVLVAAILLLLFCFYWQTGQKGEATPLQSANLEQEKAINEEEVSVVVVDIKGAVRHEGVYELANGSRVREALEKAGGLLPEAETGGVNLAQFVHDQMMIVVPRKGEQPTTASAQKHAKVAINIATREELEQIPGIGPKKAESILKYREQHGSFRKLEDLLGVEGIGEKSLEKLKDEIIVP